jgi:hypothetical protein
MKLKMKTLLKQWGGPTCTQDYALKIFLNSITIVSYPFPKNVDLYLDWWAKWKHFPNTLLYSKSFYWRALEILKGFVLWRANQSDPLHKKEKEKNIYSYSTHSSRSDWLKAFRKKKGQDKLSWTPNLLLNWISCPPLKPSVPSGAVFFWLYR